MRRNREMEPPYEEAEPTRRYDPAEEPQDGDATYRVLPDDDDAPYGDASESDAAYPPYGDAPAYPPEEDAADDVPAEYDGGGFYDEETGEYIEDEAQESAHRMRVAMSALDIFGVIAGCVCIFVLVTLLISLFNWLAADITHGLSLFGSSLQ